MHHIRSFALLAALVFGGVAETADAAGSIEGFVSGASGAVPDGARVFLEPGARGAVRTARIDSAGAFRFDGLASGAHGVFAWAPGYGFAGRHLNLAIDDRVSGIRVVLREGASISGNVRSSDGEAVAGAVLISIALLGADKVGIPYAKLGDLGFDPIRSDGQGGFRFPFAPATGELALKIRHPSYAQEAIDGVRAGQNVAVTLYPGIALQGVVTQSGQNRAVAGALVTVRSAQPPFDSVLVSTDASGAFEVRVKPGVYLARAESTLGQTAGWETVTLTGETQRPRIRLAIAETGSIGGAIRDAVSGQGIPGVRLALVSNGQRAAVQRTGQDGQYRFDAVPGEHAVSLEAAPGYWPPETTLLRLTLGAGESRELPGMWLAPLPELAVEVVDAAGGAVSGALVTMLRPYQFGWREANAYGQVQIQVENAPLDGRIVGMAERADGSQGALFAIRRANSDEPARVQLYDWATVRGSVENDRGRSLEGAVVGAVFPGEQFRDALLLWRTVAGDDGVFAWPAVVPGVPIACLARSGPAGGESAPINPQPGENVQAGSIVVAGGERERSQGGRRIDLDAYPQACGPDLWRNRGDGRTRLVMFCGAEEALAVIEGLTRSYDLLHRARVTPLVVCSAPPPCDDSGPVAVLQGEPPGRAQTYVLDSDWRVRHETFGQPPLALLADRE